MPFNVLCAACGVSFVADRSSRKVCGRTCAGVLKSSRVEGSCLNCGNHFSVPASYAKKSNVGYCCRACYLTAQTRNRVPVADRFWSKVDKRSESECWLWLGAKAHGYGRIGRRDKGPTGAHCVSYEMANGPIPEGMQINHRCDVRACVNPAHLYAGTAAQNTDDLIQRGPAEGLFAAGERHHSAKLSAEDVKLIRESGANAAEIAKRFGINADHVYGIRSRKKWRHVA